METRLELEREEWHEGSPHDVVDTYGERVWLRNFKSGAQCQVWWYNRNNKTGFIGRAVYQGQGVETGSTTDQLYAADLAEALVGSLVLFIDATLTQINPDITEPVMHDKSGCVAMLVSGISGDNNSSWTAASYDESIEILKDVDEAVTEVMPMGQHEGRRRAEWEAITKAQRTVWNYPRDNNVLGLYRLVPLEGGTKLMARGLQASKDEYEATIAKRALLASTAEADKIAKEVALLAELKKKYEGGT